MEDLLAGNGKKEASSRVTRVSGADESALRSVYLPFLSVKNGLAVASVSKQAHVAKVREGLEYINVDVLLLQKVARVVYSERCVRSWCYRSGTTW